MKNTNKTGIVIIVIILLFAIMKSFDIEFNLNNIKKMSSVGVGLIIAILIFLSMQSKKSSNPEHYIEPEIEPEENKYNNQINYDNLPSNSNIPVTQYNQNIPIQLEENNNNYNNESQIQPSVYITPPEEDNRW